MFACNRKPAAEYSYLNENFLQKCKLNIVPQACPAFVTCSDGELGGPGDGNEV